MSTCSALIGSGASTQISIDALPMACIVVDRRGWVVQTNPAAQALELSAGPLPPDWLDKGPLVDCLETARPTAGRIPGPGRGLHWSCQPHGQGVLCMQTAVPDQAARDQRLRLLEEVVDLAGVGGWELELSSMQPFWTDRTCAIHDLPPGHRPSLEEAVNFYAPGAREKVDAGIARGIETGEDWDLELPLITAKGRRIQVRARGRAVVENGHCVRLLGSFEDITERSRVQRELAESHSQNAVFARLFSHTNALLAVATAEGTFTLLTDSWTKVFGWSLDELRAAPYLSFVHPEDLEAAAAEAAAFAEGDHATFGFRCRFRTASGDYIPLMWNARSDPETGLVFGAAADLTEAVEHARQLERLATIASRTINSVVITDASGTIEWVNRSFTDITGYTAEEAIGRRPGPLLQGPATDPATKRFMGACIRAGKGFTVQVQNHRKDGTPYWNHLETQPMHDAAGQITGYMSIGTDISTQRAAEQALRRERDRAAQLAREANAAAAAKSDFLAMMSHELRTPLNGILGSAQLLLDGSLHPDHHHLVHTLHDAGRGLLSLLNDVLDLSKLQSGKFGLSTGPLELEAMARGCVRLFRSQAELHGLELALIVEDGVPERVAGDELRLRQVLTNLLGNALKFTEQGRVVLRLSSEADGRVRFSVEDTGIGIPEAAQERLFAPFTQVDASPRRRAGGTGLGLSISQQLVRLMGGDIRLASEEGIGSTFSFALPLEALASRTVRETELATAPIAVAPVDDTLVLMVEDNAINRLIGTKMLERIGCRVVVAEHGRQALELAGLQAFDLVLMDCHMPELDGWAATRELRRLGLRARTGGHLPIVAQTASCMPEEVEHCLAAGMDEVLPKPVDLQALRAVVSRWTTAEQLSG